MCSVRLAHIGFTETSSPWLPNTDGTRRCEHLRDRHADGESTNQRDDRRFHHQGGFTAGDVPHRGGREVTIYYIYTVAQQG